VALGVELPSYTYSFDRARAVARIGWGRRWSDDRVIPLTLDGQRLRHRIALRVKLADEDAVVEGALFELQGVAGGRCSHGGRDRADTGLDRPRMLRGCHRRRPYEGNRTADEQRGDSSPYFVNHQTSA